MQYKALIELDLEADSPEEARRQAEAFAQQICDESFCECARVAKMETVASFEEASALSRGGLCEMPLCPHMALYEGWIQLQAPNSAFRLNRRRIVCENHKSLLIGAPKEN